MVRSLADRTFQLRLTAGGLTAFGLAAVGLAPSGPNADGGLRPRGEPAHGEPGGLGPPAPRRRVRVSRVGKISKF